MVHISLFYLSSVVLQRSQKVSLLRQMDSLVTGIILLGLSLSCHHRSVASTDHLAQFTLPDNNQPLATPLGNIISKLQSPFPTGTYKIITRKCSYSKFNQYFRLSDSGDLFLTRTFDRDDINNVCGPLTCCDKPVCRIVLDVMVTLRQTNQKYPVRVSIEVVDENDNSPTFMEDLFFISIPENEKIFTSYSLPSADDADSPMFKIKNYTLSGKGEENFALKMVNESPCLIPRKSFDYEDLTQRQFEFLLTAEDYGGRTGGLNLRVNISDINDNSPVCLDKNANISIIENTTYPQAIFTFRATDLDSGDNSRISFRFSATTIPVIKDTFRLDILSGKLFLSKKLDYELYSEQRYKINIQVTDNGLPKRSDLCAIEIHVSDINDNSPTIDIVQTNPIPENTIVKEPVLKFDVRDEDSRENEVTCRMAEASRGLRLTQEEKYSYQVYTSAVYDYEREGNLTLVVVCQDSGRIPRQTTQLITIPVRDRNDNYPKFVKVNYRSFVAEDFAVGKPFVRVSATDADSAEFGRIRYEIGRDSKHQFAVDKTSGDVMLLRSLDRESVDRFNITVIAIDGGNLKGYTNVDLGVLDVNDNAPVLLLGQRMNVTENVAHGSVVGHFLISDLDQGDNGILEWRHELLGNATYLLEVDNRTILTVGDIDREVHDRLYIVVTMTDRGTPSLSSTATITVSVLDQNDNIPVVEFPLPGVTLDESDGGHVPTNSPRYTPVVKIRSYDPDEGLNGQVLYHMQQSNGSKHFLINETDGHVLTNWVYDALSFTPTHPREGLYRISFSIYNQVKSTKNDSASSSGFFFIRVVPYRHFINNDSLQQFHRRPFFNNVVLLILIGGFTVALSAALIAAIVWAKSKYASESSTLDQAQGNDGKFMMMMMMNGEQQNSTNCNNSYVYDPYCSLILDHERTVDSGYPLSHSRSSTFNTRRTGREHTLVTNCDNKTMPRNTIQPDMARYCASDLYNYPNSLSSTDLVSSASMSGRQPKLTNSFYRHFEHDSHCHSPILQSINQTQSLEHHYGTISPRAASICDPTPTVATTSNWIPHNENGSKNFTIC